MKYKLMICLMMIVLLAGVGFSIWGGDYIEAHGIAWSSGGSVTVDTGIGFTTNNTVKLITARKHTSDTSTTIELLNADKSLNKSVAWGGVEAIFNVELMNTTQYYFVVHKGGANYDRYGNAGPVGPIGGKYVNWDCGIVGATFDCTGGFAPYGVVNMTLQINLPDRSPIVTLIEPVNNSVTISLGVLFNCTASDDKNITNVSLYIDGVLNQTDSSGLNNSAYIFTEILDKGSYNWTCEAIDSINQSTIAPTQYFSIGDFVETSQTFNAIAISGSSQEFIINVSYDSGEFTNSFATLNYNGTSYVGTRTSDGESFAFTRTITVPDVSTAQNKPFNWTIVLNNGTDNVFRSTEQNQTVTTFAIGNCSAYNYTLYNFTIRDEIEQNIINATWYNSTADLNLQIYTLDRTSLVQNFSTSYTLNETDSFVVCLSSNLSGGESYSLDLQVQYDADDYAPEFYHIQREILTSSDINTSINLYDLDDNNAQEFKITYKDENFLPVGDALIQVQRKYIDEGLFKVVEIPKTDANGETLARLQLSDAIYTFVIVKNGFILATFDNVLAVCNNVATGDCEINFNSFTSHIAPKNYVKLDDFSFSLTNPRGTRTIQVIYSIPSSTVSTVKLNATLYDLIGNTEVCSDTLVSSGGTLTCNVPDSYGNTTVIVVLSKDGVTQAEGVITLQALPEDIYGANIVFLTIFLFLTLIGMGISSNPIVLAITIFIGVVLSIVLNLTDATGFIGPTATILWLLIIIVIVFIKGARRI